MLASVEDSTSQDQESNCVWSVGEGDCYINGDHWYGNVEWFKDVNDFCFKTYGEGGVNNEVPNTPTITGEINGAIQTSYDYTIQTTDPDLDDIKYQINWGDNTATTTGFNESGKQVVVSHTWDTKGTYRVQVKAVDEHNAGSDSAILSVTMPCSYNIPLFQFWERLLERFPNAFPLLRQLVGY
jgi:hypothetical protein